MKQIKIKNTTSYQWQTMLKRHLFTKVDLKREVRTLGNM